MVKRSLTNLVNSAFITYENHSQDNTFMSSELARFEADILYRGYEPYGVCFNVPYNPYGRKTVAYVFKEDGEIRWVHMPEVCLLHLLSSMYGRPAAKEMIAKKLRHVSK